DRIRDILRRLKPLSKHTHTIMKVGHLYIYPKQYEAEINSKRLTFTQKEFELLLYLATHKGIVLSREQLLKEVWKYDFAGDTRIVDVHISWLREKILTKKKLQTYIKTIHRQR